MFETNSRYYVVFQNKTYDEERMGGYLWAPKTNDSNKFVHYWDRMRELKKGDIIFSLLKREIVSANTVTEDCISAKIPKELESHGLWDKEGWLVKAQYSPIKRPVSVQRHIDKFLEMMPSKYAPFSSSGRGNQGYLFEISSDMGKYILDLIK